MAFSSQTFSVGQILTAAQMNQVDSNIDAVRSAHIGNSAPGNLTAGVAWIDNTSNPWIVKNYDGADWIEIFRIDATNNLFLPSSTIPLFSAYNSADDDNVTGDGTSYGAVDFNTEIFDTGSDFSGDVFTAPVDGKYLLIAQVTMHDLASAQLDQMDISTSNRDYRHIYIGTLPTQRSFIMACIADMDSADTAKVSLYMTGQGSALVDVDGSSSLETYFCGALLG